MEKWKEEMKDLINNYDPLPVDLVCDTIEEFNIGATLSQLNINTFAIIYSFENGNDGQIYHKNQIKMKKHRSKKWRNGKKK